MKMMEDVEMEIQVADLDVYNKQNQKKTNPYLEKEKYENKKAAPITSTNDDHIALCLL